jgi:hypothetical protein
MAAQAAIAPARVAVVRAAAAAADVTTVTIAAAAAIAVAAVALPLRLVPLLRRAVALPPRLRRPALALLRPRLRLLKALSRLRRRRPRRASSNQFTVGSRPRFGGARLAGREAQRARPAGRWSAALSLHLVRS